MKVTQEIIDILKNFNVINPSMYFDGTNILKTKSLDKTVFVEVSIPEFLPDEFAFYDIGSIISMLSKDNDISIKTEKDVKKIIIEAENYNIKYRVSSIELIKERTLNRYNFDDMTIESDFNFYLNKDQLKKLVDISNKIGNDIIRVKSIDNENIIISSYTKKQAANEFNLNVKCDHIHSNNMYDIVLDKIKLIDASDYKFDIGLRVNSSGVKIPMTKIIANYNSKIAVKYILLTTLEEGK